MAAKECREEGCGAPPLKEASDDRCLFHSSSDLARHLRRTGRETGGKNSRKAQAQDRGALPPPPDSYVALEAWSSWLIQSLADGTLSQGMAGELRPLIRDHASHLERANEERRLEERVEDLVDTNKRLTSELERLRQKNQALQIALDRAED